MRFLQYAAQIFHYLLVNRSDPTYSILGLIHVNYPPKLFSAPILGEMHAYRANDPRTDDIGEGMSPLQVPLPGVLCEIRRK